MTKAGTVEGGMAALAAHEQVPDESGPVPHATSSDLAALDITSHRQGACATRTIKETVGCELAAEVVRSYGSLRLRVRGASMLPAVWPGDIVSVRKLDAVEALPGDIVVFRRDGQLVTHRVVKRISCQGRIQWVTRGDRVSRDDAPVSSQELLGRVTAIERGSRRFTPHQSVAGRVASWIFAHSDLATRVVLKVGAIRETGHGIWG